MQITPFEQSPHAPYEVGKVPQAGWFAVEPACEWAPKDQSALREAIVDTSGLDYEARLTEDDLATLAANFRLADTDGAGLPVSRVHEFAEAYGWIKALHAADGMLWAWIEWTPEGHKAVDGRAFVFFSSEYDYPDFELVSEGIVTPRRLAGLTVTNYPNHTGQTPMTNSRVPATHNHQPNTSPTMKPKTNRTRTAITKAARDTNTGDTTDKDTALAQVDTNNDSTQPDDADPVTEDGKDTNTDPDKETDCNEDDTALGILIEIADALGLDESADADGILAAIEAQQAKIEELTKALAAANSAAAPDTNSRRNRYPGLTRLNRDLNQRRLSGDKPNRDVNVRINGRNRQVNCQDKAMTDYCQGRIDKEEGKLGRSLTPGEYGKTWSRAMNDWRDGRRD